MTMFHRSGPVCVARFSTQETRVLRQVVAELATMMASPHDRTDPVMRRLFPDVYPDNPDENSQFRQITEPDLTSAKLDQARTVLAGLVDGNGEVRLDDEAADAWLRALTDLRIAIGVRLEITDETDIETELDEAVLRHPTSPRVGQLSIYAFLSYLQESLLAALTMET